VKEELYFQLIFFTSLLSVTMCCLICFEELVKNINTLISTKK
jgi:hypothetical protein